MVYVLQVHTQCSIGAQLLSGRVLDLRLRGRGFKPHQRHCVVSWSKNINPSLVLVKPRKTRPFIIERLLMGRKIIKSNKQNQLIPSADNSVTSVLLEAVEGPG